MGNEQRVSKRRAAEPAAAVSLTCVPLRVAHVVARVAAVGEDVAVHLPRRPEEAAILRERLEQRRAVGQHAAAAPNVLGERVARLGRRVGALHLAPQRRHLLRREEAFEVHEAERLEVRELLRAERLRGHGPPARPDSARRQKCDAVQLGLGRS